MSIFLNSNFTNVLSRVVQHVENPNYPTGVLIEEIPSDVGRTVQSYKRGGIIEGQERFFREALAALVWLGGIPAFNALGKLFFEKVMHLPMDMDYDDKTIQRTVSYILNGSNPDGLDVSELKKYASFTTKSVNPKQLAKNVKAAKAFCTIGAVILNCLAMGIAIPKVCQAITKKRLSKQKSENTKVKTVSFDEFKNKTANNKPSFKGNIGSLMAAVPYLAENNNTFRLIITDIPTILGRVATSRNRYEALENAVIDAGSIYFYNFAAHRLQKHLRHIFNVPALNPMVMKEFADVNNAEAIKQAMIKVKDSSKQLSVAEMFEDNLEFAKRIYKYFTFGKYDKINRYVSDKTIKNIDAEVYMYIKQLSKRTGFDKTGVFHNAEFIKQTKLFNIKNASFLAGGFAFAIFGLAYLLPKLAFKLTTLLTGKNEFTGIANFEDDSVKKS